LDVGMKREDLDNLRIGWDLLIDLDVKDFEIAKIATKKFIEALQDHGVKNIGVKFSVDYSEPIVIRDNGKFRLISIGEFVDDIIENSRYAKIIPEVSGERVDIKNKKIEIACFNPRTLKIEFKPISYVLRHKISEPLYEITLKTGRKVKVTGSHSIFVLEGGEIKPKMVQELKKGDYVVMPKKLPESEEIREINVLEEMLKLSENKIKYLYYFNGDKKIPLLELKRNPDKSKDLEDGYISFLNSEYKLPIKLRITKELCRLVGYYVAEGCTITKKTYSVILSFGSHEKYFIEDAVKCVEKCFRWKVRYHQPHRSGIQLLFGGKLGTILFEDIFKVGENAKTKRIPSFIFNASRENKIEFLRGYFGDGYSRRREIVYKTSSKDLASDLSYLFLQLGIVASINEEGETIRNLPSQGLVKFSRSYSIGVFSSYQLKGVPNILPRKSITIASRIFSQSPLAIPTNHSGLRQLYNLVHMKRNPKMRSRIFSTEHLLPEKLLEVVEYLEKNRHENLSAATLEFLLSTPRSTTEIASHLKKSNNIILRVLKKLEKENLVLRLKKAKGIGRGGTPIIWSIKDMKRAINYLLEHKNNQEKARRLINFLKTLAKGDLCFAPVKSIRKVKPSSTYVYDISVGEYENFVGGFGGVILHNTGGKSFHVIVPFESFPSKVNGIPTKNLYPELSQKIIEYLKWYIKDELKEALLAIDNPNNISQRVGKPLKEILVNDELDPFKVITVDIFGSRHLFRMPYSLNENTMLVSLPLKIEEIDSFQKEQAEIKKAKIEESFLKIYTKEDATALVVEALDWYDKNHKEEEKPIAASVPKKPISKNSKIPEEFFPPCIKKILEGLSDGRKRAIFVLVTFLRNMNWSLEEIEKKIYEWNEKNKPPLRANYLRTQLRWHFRQDRNLLPPNCDNKSFYEDMGLKDSCEECLKLGIKNPVNYPFAILKRKKKKTK